MLGGNSGYIGGKFNHEGSEYYQNLQNGNPTNNSGDRGYMYIRPYSTKSNAATEGALIAEFEGLRWYEFDTNKSNTSKFDIDGRYNNFGVWATNIDLYRHNSVSNKITPKTTPFLSKNNPTTEGGIGYGVAKDNVLKLIPGTKNLNPHQTYSGWVFAGDVGPNREYEITLLHNWGRYGNGHTKVRSWRKISGKTAKLKNVKNFSYSSSTKKMSWTKGSNYASELLEFEITRKRIGESGLGTTVYQGRGVAGKNTYEFEDRDVNNETGDYVYTIYTKLNSNVPSDWKRSRDDAEAGKELTVKYRNTSLTASENLKNRIRLEWRSFEAIDVVERIWIYRDLPNSSVNNITQEPIAKLSMTATSYSDEDIIPGMIHTYRLVLVDRSDNDITREAIGFGDDAIDLEVKGTSLVNGRISGYVKTANDVPLVNAKINLSSINPLSKYKYSNGTDESYQLAETFTDNTGFYEIYDLYYRDSSTFLISASIPNNFKKRFRSDTIYRRLDINEYNVKNVDFVDTASFVVSGFVYYPNVGDTDVKLPVAGASVYVNGREAVTTDEDGYYSIPITTVEAHTFEVRVDGHTIVSEKYPEQSSIRFDVDKDFNDINFIDKTLRPVVIDVHAYNDAPIGDYAHVRVTSLSPQLLKVDNGAPFVKVYDVTTHLARYGDGEIPKDAEENLGKLKLYLPPTEFTIQVDDVFGVVNENQSVPFSLTAVKEEMARLIDTVNLDIIDSLDNQPIDKLSKFVYYGHVELNVNQKTDPKAFFTTLYDIERDDDGNFGGKYQILSENEEEHIRIQLKHIYSYRGRAYDAYIDKGEIDITDEISDRGQEVANLKFEQGFVDYTIRAGNPYFEFPYSKSLTIVGYLNNRIRIIEGVTTSAIVVGELNRIGTFYTRTPEKPLFILHDPPGDRSYASIEKGISKTFVTEYLNTSGGQAGALTDTKIGFGTNNVLTGEIGTAVHFTMQQIGGRNNSDGTRVETTFEFVEEFSTSAEDDFIGDGGDIYVGNSKNLSYSLTDVLGYDRKNKKLLRTVATTLDSINMNTTFIYTENHITGTLFNQIENLIKIAEADSLVSYQNLQKAAQDLGTTNLVDLMKNSAYLSLWETHQTKRGDVFFHQKNLESWREVVEKNASNKEEARPFTFPGKRDNISFSAGASYTSSVMLDTVDAKVQETEVFWEMSGSVGAYFIAGGKWAESDIAAVMGSSVREISVDESEVSQNQTTTFHLEDDDIGDFFTVDILKDPEYGTPVFKLKAGTASCPPEEGAQHRAKASMVHVGSAIQANVPSNQPAKFQVKMSNMSESDEERTYGVRVISNKNLNGARILFAGQDITTASAQFDLKAFTDKDKPEYIVPIELYKGAMELDYNDIDIVMYPECTVEFFDYKENETMSYITLSATFQNPCTPVVLFKPGSNWIVNQSHNNLMNYVLREYDASASSQLSQIRFEIRRLNSGGDWEFFGPTLTKEELLAKGSTLGIYQESIDVSSYPDGEYEIRAVTYCDLGANYTPAVAGKIDRQSAVLYGIPTPANGILTKSDVISVAYNKEIRNDGKTPINVSLIDVDTNQEIPATAVVNGKSIEIKTVDAGILDQLENHFLIAKVWNVIDDASGNLASDTVAWEFVINRSNVFWSPNSITAIVEEGTTGITTTTLKNTTALAQDFSIINYPSWLTPSVRNGKVNARGELRIDFSVSNTLNTGNYQDTVSVLNEGKEQYLYINIDVIKKGPEWKVDPSKYRYNMNVVAQFSIDQSDTSLSKDIYDKVAIVSKNEVRGVANIEFDPNLNKYYAFITAYSNSNNEEMSFRFWDAQPGIEYEAKEKITFVNGAVINSTTSPLILHPQGIAQTIQLRKGWNWVSLFLSNDDMSIQNILSTLKASNADIIRSLINSGQYSEYHKDLGWTGTMSTFEEHHAYGIYVNKDDTIRVVGKLINNELLKPLNKGWNSLGYSMPFNIELNKYLQTTNFSDGDRILSNDEFAIYQAATATWAGSLKYLRPNQGYKVYTNSNDVKFPISTYARYQAQGNDIVPELASARLLSRSSDVITAEMMANENIRTSNFEDGMTTTASLNIGGIVANSNNAQQRVAYANNALNRKVSKQANTGNISPANAAAITDRYEIYTYVGEQLLGISRFQALNNGEIRGFLSTSLASNHSQQELSFVIYDRENNVRYTAKTASKIVAELGSHLGSVDQPIELILEGDSDIEITTNLVDQDLTLGEELSYDIVVKNVGRDIAVNINLEESIPSGFTLKSAQASKVITSDNNSWKYHIINLDKNQEEKIRVVLQSNRVGIYQIAQIEALVNNDENLLNNRLYGNTIQVKDRRANESNIYIPSVMTPNGDGINDMFEISGLGQYIHKVRVVIYDKTSTIVYRNDDYKNNWNGGNLPIGAYGYLVEGLDNEGKPVEFSGYISIVR